jgi:hypothetical protein
MKQVFSPMQKQAAFKLLEEITRISVQGVTDETYDKVIEFFSEQKTAQLTLIIITINSWNRIAFLHACLQVKVKNVHCID